MPAGELLIVIVIKSQGRVDLLWPGRIGGYLLPATFHMILV